MVCILFNSGISDNKTWIRYDSTIVVGSKLIVSNYGDTELGKMRSLEAVIFEK
ncbi:MAG: hypothetical protein SPL21_02090 [Fibrobacter sp.]|nr:hypothetical protein [Fibrobacter sp.]